MSYKFVHAADVHLDSPLYNLRKYDGAPVDPLVGATRKALDNLVDVCISEKAKFLLISGDLYDGNWKDARTGLYFARQMGLLNQAGIRVFVIRGNHDAENAITSSLPWPENVKVFASGAPETEYIDDLGTAIHGQSFEGPAISCNLASNYPKPTPKCLNIGLLHTCAGRGGHSNYAPCTQDELLNSGYNYWALGHVHNREAIAAGKHWLVFPGNTQGRHIRETGAKGCYVVSVDDLEIKSVDFQPLDVFRWVHCIVDATQATSLEDICNTARAVLDTETKATGGDYFAVRFTITGASEAHYFLQSHSEETDTALRARASEAYPNSIWVENVNIRTSPPSTPLISSPAAREVLQVADELSELTPWLQNVRAELADFLNKMPYRVRQGEDFPDINDDAVLSGLVADAKDLLLGRLQESTKR